MKSATDGVDSLPGPAGVVETKVGPRRWNSGAVPRVKEAGRSGVVTGARIVLLFIRGELRVASSAQVADRLEMERGYVRRVLNQLVEAHIMVQRVARQPGTPDVNVYRLRNPPRRPHRATDPE